jgi:hypothetical protein
MATRCERCRTENTEVYDRGPWAGTPKTLDYCKYYSADLCTVCMKHGLCVDAPNDKHEVDPEDSE